MNSDALLPKPASAGLVVRNGRAVVVSVPIDFDAQAPFCAIEIENVWTDWVLPSEA
jgi:hypothetical protein